MFLKVIALIAFIGACQAEEHAYSSQSITRFDHHHNYNNEHHGHEDHKYEDHKHEEQKYENHGNDDHKHYKHVEHNVEHKVAHPLVHHVAVEHKAENHKQVEHKVEQKKYIEQKHEHNEQKVEHKVEHKFEHKVEHKVEHKQNHHENKQEEHKEKKYSHEEYKHDLHTKVIPVVEKHTEHLIKVAAPVKVVPIAQYVHKGSEEEHNKHYEHAISSQHISRHDVPAPPPKGFSDHSGPAKYEFAYEVKDPHTGDHKYQHESRDGHTLKGVYSLHEADGSIRTVEYGADKHTGFSAAVKQTTKHVEEKHHH